MSQNSEQIESKLCAYIDGELDEKDRADIEQHLLAHPHHRHLLKELAETRRLLRLLPRESAPQELSESFQGQLERSVLLNDSQEQVAYPSPMRINRLPQYLAAAAVVVLAAGLGIVVYFALPQPRQTVVIKNPETSPSLSPDEQRLVNTFGSKDSKDKDRANDIEPIESGLAANGARPDALQQDLAAAGKSDKAMRKAEVAEKAANATGEATGNADKGGVRSKFDEAFTDAKLRAGAKDDGRNPIVIVVSAADPQKARLDAYEYLGQLGVKSETLERETLAASDAASAPADGLAGNANAGTEVSDHDAAAQVYEQAKRVMARQSKDSPAMVTEKAKQQVAQGPGELGDVANRQLKASSRPSEQNSLNRAGDASGGAGRSNSNARGGFAAPGETQKAASPAATASTEPEKKGPGHDLKVPADAARATAPAPGAPAAAPVAQPVHEAMAKPEEVAQSERVEGIRQNDRVIVAQNVTREQLESLRDAIQSDESARLQVVDGAEAGDAKRMRRSEFSTKAGREAEGTTDASLHDGAPDGLLAPAKPGTNAVSDPAAGAAAPKVGVQPQRNIAGLAGTPSSRPATTTAPRAAGPATTRSAAAAATTVPATVQTGDRLHVIVTRTEADADEIEEDVVVGRDGTVKLPESKTVQSAGASVAQVESRIAQAYRADVAQGAAEMPKVSVKRLPAVPPTTAAIAKKIAPVAPPVASVPAPAEPAAPVKSTDRFDQSGAQQGQAAFDAGNKPAVASTTGPDQLDVVIVFRSAIAGTTVPATTPADTDDPAVEPEPATTPAKLAAEDSGVDEAPSENSDATPK